MEKRVTDRLLFSAFLIVSIFGLVMSAPSRSSAQEFDTGDYTYILNAYVDDRGMVDYRGLKEDRGRLDTFSRSMEELKPEFFNSWTKSEKIAFWINAYNSLTLVAIIDHYPIKASAVRSLVIPKNSILQIPGVWTDLKYPMMGGQITLDSIEHKRLRPNFNEPRIHMALVCAAMGCPRLLNRPYSGAELDSQLDGQTRDLLSNRKKFRIDRESDTVYLSSIFKWFGEDFVARYGTEKLFSGHSVDERAVLNFISGYLDKASREYLINKEYRIRYLDYDWTLNERQ